MSEVNPELITLFHQFAERNHPFLDEIIDH